MRRVNVGPLVGAMVGGVALALSACGTGDHSPLTGGLFGSGGGSGRGGLDSGLQFGASGSLGSVLSADGAACAAEVRKGELLPLDLYVLLDKSGSMTEPTANGATKWASISTALEQFVQDPASAGLGVGIQYFPLLKPGVPATCTSHAECGAGGPCLLTACDNQSTVSVCVSDADCGGGRCAELGWCERYPQGGSPVYCSPIGGQCPTPYGNCIDIRERPCLNGIDCSADRYATPDVPIVTLPAGAPQLVASIQAAVPTGNTPTAPALEGAVSHAKAWATAHPGHTVVAVLATDGLPTECTPLDITQVAAFASAGVAGTPKIVTFVIGVFAAGDTQSPANLQTIAQAGGTNHAFIVDTSQDVATEFRKALDAIRGSSLLSCELEIPASSTAAGLNFDLVNLTLVDKSDQATQLVYVGSTSQCAGTTRTGWYYDVDPKTGGTPTKIVLCEDVCTKFRSMAGARLAFQIGCATVLR